MRSALRRMLTVDERVVGFAVAVPVRDDHFDVLSAEVNGRVERLFAEVFLQQVEQPVFRDERLPVDPDRQPGVQVSVVAYHRLHVFHVKVVAAENAFVGMERHHRPVPFADAAFGHVRDFVPLLEPHAAGFAVAHAADQESVRQRVDRLDADAVQSDRFFKRFRVVFRAGVHFRRHVHQFAERHAASVVAYGDGLVVRDRDVDALAEAHHVFVYGVVQHLFDQDVDPVVGGRSVAEFPDIHTRPPPDVLFPIQCPDVFVPVICNHTHSRFSCSYLFYFSFIVVFRSFAGAPSASGFPFRRPVRGLLRRYVFRRQRHTFT